MMGIPFKYSVKKTHDIIILTNKIEKYDKEVDFLKNHLGFKRVIVADYDKIDKYINMYDYLVYQAFLESKHSRYGILVEENMD